MVPKNWNCEQWLLQIKSPENEDFEILSMEQEAVQAFGNAEVNNSSIFNR